MKLRRISDGEIFVQKEDGTFLMEATLNDGHLHHSWSFSRLMDTDGFEVVLEYNTSNTK